MGLIKKIIYSQNPLIEKVRNIKILRDFYTKHIKRFDNNIIVYLTLACNLNCSYCVNKFHGSIHDFKLLSGKEWIKIINREGKNIIFTGGEPTLHPDFIDIVNGIGSKINIELFTNLKWPDSFLKKYIKEVDKPLNFYASYHPSYSNPDEFIDILNKLKAANKFKGSVHAVSTTDEKNKRLKKHFAKKGINLAIDEDQYSMFEGCSKKFKKKVLCSKKIYLIAPNGDRFRCVSYMVRNKEPIQNLKKEKLSEPTCSAICNEYGYCAPCDLMGNTKIKRIKE